MEKLLVDQEFKLQKMAGKGGWTFIVVPGIPREQRGKLGQVKVRGRIDSYELEGINLMSMANGDLFLPVKSAIRKAIRKEDGATVRLTLYFDDQPLAIPQELLDCLLDEPVAHENFMKLGEGSRREFREWIYNAKKIETRVERIVKMIDMLKQGQKLTGNFLKDQSVTG